MARTSRSVQRASVGLLLLALLVSCASPAPASPAPASPVSTAGPGASLTITLPNGVQPGPVDAATALALVPAPAVDQDRFAAAAGELGATLRARVDAKAVYGQTAADLQSLMDQTETTALQKLEAKVKTVAGRSDAGTVELASFRWPDTLRPGSPRMALLAVAMLFLIAAGGTAIGMFDPRAGDIPSTTLKDSESTTSGSRTMDVNSTFVFSSSGGVVTVAIDLSGNGSGTDPTGKATSLTGSASIVFSVNPCPDPSGHVGGSVGVSDAESFSSSGSPTVGYKIAGSTDYTTTVNDQAEIDSTQITTKMDQAVTTTTASTGGGSPDATTVDLAATGVETFTASGGTVPGAEDSFTLDRVEGPAQVSDLEALGKTIGIFGYGPPLLLSSIARQVWRAGKCFEIRPKADGGAVSPNSKNSIDVTVYHWVDKADIKVPVKATLAGTKAVDPDGQPLTSPAKFTFTAGAPSSTGDVTYNVTSNRGMATRTSHFTVSGGLLVGIKGTYSEAAGIATYNLKVSADDILVTAQPDGSLTFSGRVSVTGTVTALVCTGKINQRIDVIGQGSVTGPDDAPVYHLQFGPGSLTSLGGTFSCPGVGASSNKGDFFGQWSNVLGYVDLPAAGGTVTLANSTGSGLIMRSARGTFTARPK